MGLDSQLLNNVTRPLLGQSTGSPSAIDVMNYASREVPQQSPQVKGVNNTDPFAGSMYYDTNTGSMRQYDGGGQYSDAIIGGGDGTYSEFNTTSNNTPADPYAKYGGQSSYNNLVGGFDTQKQNVFSSASDAAAQGARGSKASVLDFLDQYKSGQQGINRRGVRADLAKMQGAEDIRGMVGRGIQSGGVMLQNRNASDSSAADAIARAYAQIGGQQMRGVGSQYAQEQADIGLAQEDLGAQAANFQRDYEDQKISTVNNIVSDVATQLGALDAQMANADLPGRIAIEQEKQRIKGEAMATLSQYDQQLATGKAGIKPQTANERAIEANKLRTAGTELGADAFNYSTQAPAQFQGTGPFPSDLPIFTNRSNREE